VYDPSTNRIILFGGDLPGCCAESNQTWVLLNANAIGGAQQWSQIFPTGVPPVGRSGHSAVYDQTNNRMIVFGGGQENGSEYGVRYNDVWVLQNANGQGGTPSWTQLSPLGVPPAPREGQGMVYDPSSNRIMIFGGGNNGIMDIPNDVWALTNANGLGGSPQWIQTMPAGSSNAPAPRQGFGIGYDPTTNRMVVFGGCCYQLSDLWVLQNANGLGGIPAWQQLSQGTPAPGARSDFAFGYDSGTSRFFMAGGLNYSRIYVNDLWVLQNANGVGTPAWLNPIPNGAAGSPPEAPFNSGVYDPTHTELFVFPDTGDLWLLTNATVPPVVLIIPGILGTKLASTSGVVWLSDETIYDTAPPLNLPDLYQLEYDSTGQPTTVLSVQAVKDGVDYGGLFNLASDKGDLEYELECTLLIRTLLAIDGQVCDRTFRVYNALVNALTTAGFTYDVFPYDWREDIGQLADQLNQKVSSLTAQYPGRQIGLVAHSMGGLVVGAMFANYGVSPMISHVITLGSPFVGSVQTYFEFEGWRSFYPQISPQQSQEIGANWTAAYELLPQWKFAHLQNGARPPVMSIYKGTYSSLFPALPRSKGPNSALTAASSLWKAEKSVPLIPQAYAIVGSGVPTLTVLTNVLSQGNCLQGVYGDGDNTVPVTSALGSTWVPSQNVGFVKSKHAELPENGDAINAIIQILNGSSPTTLSQVPFGVSPSSTGCCPGPTCQPPGKN
jgi:pimeloyl-ACP methyl ester carboxylesterase